MNRLTVRQIPILNDNYVYLLHEPGSGATAVVDPGEAKPVLAALGETGWSLGQILITHHHHDHVGGIRGLKAATGARVTGPAREAETIPELDFGISAGDTIQLGRLSATVLGLPGHTHGHIAYWFAESAQLFSGDVLFAMGCGRLFEGTADEMFASLGQLAALPEATQVYCTHEYTAANARFALAMEPENQALQARCAEVSRLRAAGQPTVPTTIGQEHATNPFLRSENADIRRRLDMANAPASEVFAELRRRKDRF